MRSPPPVIRAQTTKQAKAAYKARGRPSVSEKEQRQLERAVELDKRAARFRQAEQKRAELSRKRAELERTKKERLSSLPGSQRRRDRFGFVGSQMRLGAFLNSTKKDGGGEKTEKATIEHVEHEEHFDCDEVDDEVLLAATSGEASDFWHEIVSSTQIARELDADQPRAAATSFSSDDFDLTVEDLTDLETSIVQRKSTAEEDRRLMPPPALPSRRSALYTEIPAAPVTMRGGFTLDELEEFVEDDLVLTQVEPG